MVLRTTFNGYEVNIELGPEYHLIDGERCPDEFKKCCEEEFGDNIKDYIDKCYAFIFNRNGANSIPLYKGQGNYILNESGGLFKDLTYK